jgi:hypothetical protein
MKKSSDTIGNRTRDLPAFNVIPQPTAPPRAPHFSISLPYTPRTSKWCLFPEVSTPKLLLSVCIMLALFCMPSVSVSILYAACWSQYFVCSLAVLVFCMQCASVGISFAICRCWYFAFRKLLFGAKTCYSIGYRIQHPLLEFDIYYRNY